MVASPSTTMKKRGNGTSRKATARSSNPKDAPKQTLAERKFRMLKSTSKFVISCRTSSGVRLVSMFSHSQTPHATNTQYHRVSSMPSASATRRLTRLSNPLTAKIGVSMKVSKTRSMTTFTSGLKSNHHSVVFLATTMIRSRAPSKLTTCVSPPPPVVGSSALVLAASVAQRTRFATGPPSSVAAPPVVALARSLSSRRVAAATEEDGAAHVDVR
mmetsp:Transcript_44711/g.121870  ORF Transcript_44711/g.121870 Transcript_44711/m.121870 type:complete len:215 (-) Transcript_44711:246-890(-)